MRDERKDNRDDNCHLMIVVTPSMKKIMELSCQTSFMKVNLVLLALASALLIASCGHNIDTSAPIELNEGAKWTVPPVMHQHVVEMHKSVEAFGKDESAVFADLQVSLQAGTKNVIADCTMEGQGHIELHKWLLPFIDLINSLDDLESNEARSQWLSDIKASFINYHTYFE